MLPGIFQETLFTRPSNRSEQSSLDTPVFVRPIHPKTEIRPLPEAMSKFLAAGWVAQLKIHGHRAQIHISSDPKVAITVFNRHGQVHKKELPDGMVSELRRIFSPNIGWNIIDAEWIKTEDRLFVFDFLKQDGKLLRRLSFLERWKLLPRSYLSPHIQTLGVFTSLEECVTALKKTPEYIEGLVFKSSSPGFEDSSIIRCRR
jgi:ATP-dependent DNA ligase